MAGVVLGEPPAWCASYIGLPWLDKGRGRDGVDCYGIGWLVCQERRGVELPTYPTGYRSARDKESVADFVGPALAEWNAVDWGDERPFDFAEMLRTLKTTAGAVMVPLHTGIIVADGWMLECSPTHGVQLTRYPLLRATLPRFWRHRLLT